MKFNKAVGIKRLENHPDKTQNLAGGTAFTLDSKTELYQRVATCLVNEPKYYEGKNETVDRIIELTKSIAENDPEFILKLAVYARHKLLLRSIPILLLGESVQYSHVRKYIPHIISRADELSEIIAYMQAKLGDLGNHRQKGMLPNGIKRGIADTFGRFTEYQLQKYEKTGTGTVKLKDVLKLTHPKPKDEEQSALWKRLKEGNMKVAETWETVISSNGSTKENWEYAANVMPIMALLRNLRNLYDNDVGQETLSLVNNKLKDKEMILKSKQFPFRFFSAYKALEGHGDSRVKYTLAALEEAMDISCANLPRIPGITALFADISGSMTTTISGKSDVRCLEIACLMLAIADKLCEQSGTAVFSDDVWPVNLNPRNGVLSNMKEAMRAGRSGGTYTHLCLDRLQTKVDRVMIFTDQQDYSMDGNSGLAKSLYSHRQSYSPNCYLYSIDLRGYGTTGIPQDHRTSLIAGWTDRILEYVNIFEQDKKSALDAVQNYQLPSKTKPLDSD